MPRAFSARCDKTGVTPASDGKASLLRRGQVLHCREREWEGYGYGLLWMFVQDSFDQVAGRGVR